VFRGRRPLLRGAAVGAAGYAVGKRVARRRGEEAYYEDEEAAQGDSGAISDEQIESLRQLAQLKEEGILTNEEFEAQKEKLLQGG
jgi:hypothetical protein